MKACIYIPPDLATFLDSEVVRLKAQTGLNVSRSAVIQIALNLFKTIQDERNKP
mgnify:CR=1 FL=1